jgi:hypothetical protein
MATLRAQSKALTGYLEALLQVGTQATYSMYTYMCSPPKSFLAISSHGGHICPTVLCHTLMSQRAFLLSPRLPRS